MHGGNVLYLGHVFAAAMLIGYSAKAIALAGDEKAIVPASQSCPPAQAEHLEPTKRITLAPPRPIIQDSTRSKIFVSASGGVEELGKALLVDVRLSAGRAKEWVPDAIRVPPDFLKINALVQGTDLVFLIGDGKDEARIYEAVKDIPRKNLKPLKIISGGVPEWHRAGGPVAGDTSVFDGPAEVNEQEFVQLIRQGAIVALVGNATPLQRQAIGEFMELPPGAGVETNTASVRPRLSDAGFVLVLSNRADVGLWTRAWITAFHRSPFIFVDPGDRYVKFLDQQSRIAANAGKPLQHRCDWR